MFTFLLYQNFLLEIPELRKGGGFVIVFLFLSFCFPFLDAICCVDIFFNYFFLNMQAVQIFEEEPQMCYTFSGLRRDN